MDKDRSQRFVWEEGDFEIISSPDEEKTAAEYPAAVREALLTAALRIVGGRETEGDLDLAAQISPFPVDDGEWFDLLNPRHFTTGTGKAGQFATSQPSGVEDLGRPKDRSLEAFKAWVAEVEAWTYDGMTGLDMTADEWDAEWRAYWQGKGELAEGIPE